MSFYFYKLLLWEFLHNPFTIPNDTRAKTILCYNKDPPFGCYFAFSICRIKMFRGKPRDPCANYSSKNKIMREITRVDSSFMDSCSIHGRTIIFLEGRGVVGQFLGHEILLMQYIFLTSKIKIMMVKSTCSNFSPLALLGRFFFRQFLLYRKFNPLPPLSPVKKIMIRPLGLTDVSRRLQLSLSVPLTCAFIRAANENCRKRKNTETTKPKKKRVSTLTAITNFCFFIVSPSAKQMAFPSVQLLS